MSLASFCPSVPALDLCLFERLAVLLFEMERDRFFFSFFTFFPFFFREKMPFIVDQMEVSFVYLRIGLLASLTFGVPLKSSICWLRRVMMCNFLLRSFVHRASFS